MVRRYRTQLCNDGTNCKRRVCFFAHTLSELRVPSSKPFVNPQALAAAAAAAGARRTSFSNDQVQPDYMSSASACAHVHTTHCTNAALVSYRQNQPIPYLNMQRFAKSLYFTASMLVTSTQPSMTARAHRSYVLSSSATWHGCGAATAWGTLTPPQTWPAAWPA